MGTAFITGYRYYYSLLPEHMKKIYTSILNGFEARRTDFTFYAEKHNGVYPTNDLILKIYDYVLRDNPALYSVNRTNALVYYTYGAMGRVRITYTEFYTPSQRYLIDQQIKKRAEPILDYLRKQPDEYARIYDLYRYLIATIKYDRSFTPSKTRKDLEALTIVGPLLRGSGVCTGYSQLFKFLCDQVGISCFELIGTADGRNGWCAHCWNVVKLNGQFYHADVTFDSGHFHATNKYAYNYFLRSDAAMMADHKWDRTIFPAMANNYAGTGMHRPAADCYRA